MARTKGTGSIFRQTGKNRGSNPPWMIQYYDANGQRWTESSKTSDKLEARKLLNQRLGKIANGETIERDTIGRKATRFEDAVRLFKNDQLAGGHHGLARTTSRGDRPAMAPAHRGHRSASAPSPRPPRSPRPRIATVHRVGRW